MVNGNTWPFQTVEKRRYRFRFLNGCQSRFLILDFSAIPGVRVWQIGNEGGFLAKPVDLTATNGNRLLMGLAERADIIVDFTNVPRGNYVLGNVGPDEPFGGGEPGGDFDAADPLTTGQVLQFRVVRAVAPDPTTPPQFLRLPAITPLPAPVRTRPLALLEMMSMTDPTVERGPAEAMLGVVDEDGVAMHRMWDDAVTENPCRRRHRGLGVLQLHRRCAPDARPRGGVRGREPPGAGARRAEPASRCNRCRSSGDPRPREAWESGFKDTVIAYPGEVTRIRAQFKQTGPVRLALPHRRARGQRDDAAVPDRTGAARPADLKPGSAWERMTAETPAALRPPASLSVQRTSCSGPPGPGKALRTPSCPHLR